MGTVLFCFVLNLDVLIAKLLNLGEKICILPLFFLLFKKYDTNYTYDDL